MMLSFHCHLKQINKLRKYMYKNNTPLFFGTIPPQSNEVKRNEGDMSESASS